MLQGLYFKAKKSKRPFKDVIDDYLNIFIDQETITQEEKENILNIWRSRRKALSLPVFEQENMEYEIYSDMDGVLTDFDASFMKASDGIRPSEYERNYG
jgi:glycerol-3-phosphate O-acyltransferase